MRDEPLHRVAEDGEVRARRVDVLARPERQRAFAHRAVPRVVARAHPVARKLRRGEIAVGVAPHHVGVRVLRHVHERTRRPRLHELGVPPRVRAAERTLAASLVRVEEGLEVRPAGFRDVHEVPKVRRVARRAKTLLDAAAAAAAPRELTRGGRAIRRVHLRVARAEPLVADAAHARVELRLPRRDRRGVQLPSRRADGRQSGRRAAASPERSGGRSFTPRGERAPHRLVPARLRGRGEGLALQRVASEVAAHGFDSVRPEDGAVAHHGVLSAGGRRASADDDVASRRRNFVRVPRGDLLRRRSRGRGRARRRLAEGGASPVRFGAALVGVFLLSPAGSARRGFGFGRRRRLFPDAAPRGDLPRARPLLPEPPSFARLVLVPRRPHSAFLLFSRLESRRPSPRPPPGVARDVRLVLFLVELARVLAEAQPPRRPAPVAVVPERELHERLRVVQLVRVDPERVVLVVVMLGRRVLGRPVVVLRRFPVPRLHRNLPLELRVGVMLQHLLVRLRLHLAVERVRVHDHSAGRCVKLRRKGTLSPQRGAVAEPRARAFEKGESSARRPRPLARVSPVERPPPHGRVPGHRPVRVRLQRLLRLGGSRIERRAPRAREPPQVPRPRLLPRLEATLRSAGVLLFFPPRARVLLPGHGFIRLPLPPPRLFKPPHHL